MDNAVAESFFKILKSELIIHCRYTNHLHAKNDVFEFIEIGKIENGGIPIWDYLIPEEFVINNLSNVA